MKIAARISMTALATVLVFGLSGVCPASAQPAPAQAAASATAVIMPAPAAPAATKGEAAVKEVLDTIKVPSASDQSDKVKAPSLKGIEADDKEAGSLSSPKIPDSVKKAVKNLNDATDGVTLENLNSAREAVVKLDVLIDIEKRLNDLSKLRKDRDDEESLADDLPRSALPAQSLEQPPSLLPTAQNHMGGPGQPIMMPSSSVEVVRVSGATGRYSAQVKDIDSSTKMVHVGDKLADGSVINAISRDGVTLSTMDKKTKTIQVKDVSTVFSGR